PAPARLALLELREKPFRGRLLRRAPACAAAFGHHAELLHAAFHDEGLVVRLALGLEDRIARQRETPRLQVLLERGLRVLLDREPFGALEPAREHAAHGRLHRHEAAVEEDRAEESLERVGEDRGTPETAALELALPEPQALSQAKLEGDLRKRGLVHERGAQ